MQWSKFFVVECEGQTCVSKLQRCLLRLVLYCFLLWLPSWAMVRGESCWCVVFLKHHKQKTRGKKATKEKVSRGKRTAQGVTPWKRKKKKNNLPRMWNVEEKKNGERGDVCLQRWRKCPLLGCGGWGGSFRHYYFILKAFLPWATVMRWLVVQRSLKDWMWFYGELSAWAAICHCDACVLSVNVDEADPGLEAWEWHGE